MNREDVTIYWAGRLFNQAECDWNDRCAKRLRAFGYPVILPQEEAEKFKRHDGSYDLDALAKDCARLSAECLVGIYNFDGSDVDSGTALEAGIKIENKRQTGRGFAIGVRTDFRAASEDSTTGVNAMFRCLDLILRFTPEDDVQSLCRHLNLRIMRLIEGVEG